MNSYRLDSVCDLINGGAWSDTEYAPSGIHVVKVTNLSDGRIIRRDDDYLPISKYEEYKQHKLKAGDIVVSTVGSHPTQPGSVVGRVAIVAPEFSGSFLNQNAVCIRINKSNLVSQRYFFYLANTVLFKHHIESRARGSANQVRMAIGELKKFEAQYPRITEQKKIVATLSAYDELIENNQRRIALLEKMAEEIYREWFVRLRFPGHEKVKKVKGVPDGWKVKLFNEIVEYYIGGGWGEDDQSTSFSEAAYVIRGTDIPDIQAGEFEGCPYRFHKPSNLKSRTLLQGDFVFEVSGGSTNQLLGRNVFITEHLLKYFNAPVIAASFCKQIRFRRELVSPYFMKYFMKLYYDCDLVGIYQIQSTGISNYQFESFLKYQTIVLPPDELQKKFEDIVKPIIEMRDGISLANIELRKTRDLLLPRLISGKLSVENLDIHFPPSMEETAHEV
ncbi:MAG: restriction endonuclease subunit S [Pseudomonadota bacterium]